MSKKLLSEAQVRRFQSLASIKPLVEMDSSYKKDDEEPMEEMAYKKDDHNESLYEEEEQEEEMDMDADAGDDDDMGDADVEIDEEMVEKFMDAVSTIQDMADALGGGGDMDMKAGEDEPADDLDMDMDMGGDDTPAPEAEASPEGEGDDIELQEALRGISYVPSQKEVVKIVAKRVAKRLQEAKRAESVLNKALGKK